MGGFVEYYGQTSLHWLALTVLIVLAIATILIPARTAMGPLVFAATTLPMAQRIVVGGADFTLMRILLLAYLLRIAFKGENRDLRWSRLDTFMVLWVAASTLIMTLHFGTSSAFINRVGWAFDVLLTYYATRCLVRNIDDILGLAKMVAIISIPVGILFLVEYSTHRNLFSIFGGVPSETRMREGKFRCQGPFSHPIMAGTFWASTLPLMWMLWKREGRSHLLAIAGTLAAFAVVFACSSSTPVLSAMVAFGGLALFRYRHVRKRLWVGLLCLLTFLHIVMQAPIWHLMARVDLMGGSTGWHRFRIFDAFVANFDKWWATGDSNPQGWGVWEMRDITNQFILEGLRGGLLTLTMFVLVLIYCYGNVGRTLKGIEHLRNAAAEKVVWLVGVTILIHTFTFFGVSYFGQMTAMLYIHIGLAGTLLPQILPNFLAANGGAPPPEETRPARGRKRTHRPPHGRPVRG